MINDRLEHISGEWDFAHGVYLCISGDTEVGKTKSAFHIHLLVDKFMYLSKGCTFFITKKFVNSFHGIPTSQ